MNGLAALVIAVTVCVLPSWLLLSESGIDRCEATYPTRENASHIGLGQASSVHRPRRNPPAMKGATPGSSVHRPCGNPPAMKEATPGSQVRPPEIGPLSSRPPQHELGGPVPAPHKEPQRVSRAGRSMRDTVLRCAALLIAYGGSQEGCHPWPPTFAHELWRTITNRELSRLRRFGELKGGGPWSHPPRPWICMRIRLQETTSRPVGAPQLVATRGAIGPQHSPLLPLTLGPNSLPPQRPLCHPTTPKGRGPESDVLRLRHPVGVGGGVYLECAVGQRGQPIAE